MSHPDRYQLWGGCFSEAPASVLRRMNDSLSVDARMYREDLRGSRAWARELHRSGQISEADHTEIQAGLAQVEKDIEEEMQRDGRLTDSEEDIHSAVEARLRRLVGEPALRLHTGRSRNDQSATDTRLWMQTFFHALDAALKQLIEVLLKRAGDEMEIIIPGYTHLQRAQPIRWSHFLLSYAWLLRDDHVRLEEQKSRLSRCPLGSGALAGCALPIDRARLAHQMGFQDITPNSLFGVSSRDHIVEFLNWASLCGLHLSRLSEDLIIYSSQEFGFVRISDSFSTGSSLMPQKRNPDGLELVRAAAGLLLGDSFGFSCTLKGLPSTYNKDLQYDKEILFRSGDRILNCLKVITGTVNTMEVSAAKARSKLEPNMLATDVALSLVRRGVPFREAHRLVGAVLRRANELGCNLQTLPHEEYVLISREFDTEEELSRLFSYERSVEQYACVGGTARAAVHAQLHELRCWMEGRLPTPQDL